VALSLQRTQRTQLRGEGVLAANQKISRGSILVIFVTDIWL
jgi:hypothetical protein